MLFSLLVIVSMLYLFGQMIRMSSIYPKKWMYLGRIYLKGSDSNNSRKRLAKIPLNGDPIYKPNFCL